MGWPNFPSIQFHCCSSIFSTFPFEQMIDLKMMKASKKNYWMANKFTFFSCPAFDWWALPSFFFFSPSFDCFVFFFVWAFHNIIEKIIIIQFDIEYAPWHTHWARSTIRNPSLNFAHKHNEFAEKHTSSVNIKPQTSKYYCCPNWMDDNNLDEEECFHFNSIYAVISYS